MNWIARNLGKVLLLAAGALFAGAITIGLTLDRQNPDPIGLETAKVLVTLAGGLLLGGVVKLATEMYADTRKRHAEESARYDALIHDMHASHDRMETARLLIAAHRSAKTYGEQMRGVIDAHVLLLTIARTPGMGVLEPKLSDSGHLECMLGYLVALEREYRLRYKQISTLQKFDEELTKRRFSQCAAGGSVDAEDGATCPPNASEMAWQRLNASAEFPVLDDLCIGGTEFRACFVDACAALRSELAKAKRDKLTRLPGPGAWPTEDELQTAINRRADEITKRCVLASMAQRHQASSTPAADRSTAERNGQHAAVGRAPADDAVGDG